MPEPLTTTERKVYHYLLDFLAENTYQPSVRDIGKRFKIKSTKTVSELLQSLANKGYIERDPSRSRGVRLLGFEVSRRTQPIPYFGKVAAGDPALLPDHRDGFITLDRRFVPGDECFFVRARGDSMTGRGILDGDFILVQPNPDPQDGDIAVVRIGEDATLKTISRHDGKVVLTPAAEGEQEIVLEPGRDDFGFLGTVCGVFRPYCDNPATMVDEPAE
jgi:repressor LexA